MRQVKKIIFFFAFGLLGLFASGMLLDQTLKGDGGIGSLSKSIEAMKLKAKHPGMPAAEIQRLAEKAPKGATGLLESLTNSQTLTDSHLRAIDAEAASAAEAAKTVYIKASENQHALLEKQLSDDPADATLPKGAVEAAPGGETVQLSPTSDGREVIAVVENSFEPSSDIERINALHVSEEVRQQILSNYRKTGVLPEILVKEVRKPAAQPAGSDDPYNQKNWQ